MQSRKIDNKKPKEHITILFRIFMNRNKSCINCQLEDELKIHIDNNFKELCNLKRTLKNPFLTILFIKNNVF